MVPIWFFKLKAYKGRISNAKAAKKNATEEYVLLRVLCTLGGYPV
jgi:hypothetical protein